MLDTGCTDVVVDFGGRVGYSDDRVENGLLHAETAGAWLEADGLHGGLRGQDKIVCAEFAVVVGSDGEVALYIYCAYRQIGIMLGIQDGFHARDCIWFIVQGMKLLKQTGSLGMAIECGMLHP